MNALLLQERQASYIVPVLTLVTFLTYSLRTILNNPSYLLFKKGYFDFSNSPDKVSGGGAKARLLQRIMLLNLFFLSAGSKKGWANRKCDLSGGRKLGKQT